MTRRTTIAALNHAATLRRQGLYDAARLIVEAVRWNRRHGATHGRPAQASDLAR